jgi:quercetin dioxygenase-like cupin family protein
MAKKTAPKLSKQSKRLDTKQRKSKFQLLLFKIYSQTIVNSVTGETITWLETSKDTGGKYLKFILKVDAKCSVIIEHIHPNQDERFDIKQGELKLQVRDKVYFLKPGDTMTVPKGTPHQWWNNSAFNPVIMDLTFTPAQNTELFFEQFFGLCNDGKNNPDGSFKFLQAMQ